MVNGRHHAAWAKVAFSALVFAAAYAIANRYQLVQAVLYRLAADDVSGATRHFGAIAFQALFLFAAMLLLPRRIFACVLAIAGISILANLAYSGTAGPLLEAGSLGWIIAEAGQAGNAAGEFARPLLLAAAQTAIAVVLFWAARAIASDAVRTRVFPGLLLLVLPSFIMAGFNLYPVAAERNLWTFAARLSLADPAPDRGAVTIPRSDETATPRHIVWLVDESVAYAPFARMIAPHAKQLGAIDFGRTASLGHCSAPANLALRSGVDVRRAGPQTDLRTSPSIWAYARAAGYRTRMIEGQTSGRPQNYLLEPELELIDEYVPAPGGIDIDRLLAARLKRDLRKTDRTFTLVVLRGVHFQYADHVPPGTTPLGATKAEEYAAALAYSKENFFDILMDGLDREQVAVAYLSDHGQNLAEGELAHCSRDRKADEFAIPLLAFLPSAIEQRYRTGAEGGHSASQLFAATLTWMGYEREGVEARYDNDLDKPTARYVTFGRNAVPLKRGDTVEIEVSAGFPGE